MKKIELFATRHNWDTYLQVKIGQKIIKIEQSKQEHLANYKIPFLPVKALDQLIIFYPLKPLIN